MSQNIIPTAILDDHSENIGIANMTVRYTQKPDCNDDTQAWQFLTVEAVPYDNGYEERVMKGEQGFYLVISSERWAVDDPSELSMVLNDFANRLFANSETPRVMCDGDVVIQHLEIEQPTAEEFEPKAEQKAKTRKAVDVLMENGWVTFGSIGKAAKALGVTTAWLSKSLQLGKTCDGHNVRYSNPELDACLSEIDESDKKPYEVSRRP